MTWREALVWFVVGGGLIVLVQLPIHGLVGPGRVDS